MNVRKRRKKREREREREREIMIQLKFFFSILQDPPMKPSDISWMTGNVDNNEA